ncbi:MAG TPA: adenylate/guanylate cyclase domain-containing protein [Capillimicrobium sp.]|nr:adenylate/guanylate cyclase domain-containing protein [Capillimicrobium sp.]
MEADRSTLFRRVAARFALGMVVANVGGAVFVLVLLLFVLPLPPVDDDHATRVTNVIAYVAYLAVAVPAGALWGIRLARPISGWLLDGRDPDPREQRITLLAPLRQMGVHAALWLGGLLLFVGINLTYSHRLALLVGVTVVLGGLTTCAAGYVLAERTLRPFARLALAASLPERVSLPGVTTRVLGTWALCTGVPVLGIVLIGSAQLLGVLSTPSIDRLAATAVALGGIALLVGLAALTLTASSIADPISGVRKALREVQRGRTDVEVAVYDGSEVGMLQTGFNQMVEGIRERERLRDLFGRQVGEDVARHALERGTELGGEVREVAALFVDVVGSTQLAESRPPAEVVDVLNELFCVVVEVVAEHGGAVNKFEGDAALCVFGAPLERDDPAGDALAAARDMVARLRAEVPQLDVGIGVSFGAAVAGNVGAAERFEYTVIGDPVNEAARLTELAKHEPGRVLASGSAVRAASEAEAARWRDGDARTLRGRSAPTRLWAPAVEPDPAAG